MKIRFFLFLCVSLIAHGFSLSVEMKDELKQKLDEFSTSTDNLEEMFENREQIDISRYYERLPKPTLIAAQEFIEGKVYFRNPVKEKDNF